MFRPGRNACYFILWTSIDAVSPIILTSPDDSMWHCTTMDGVDSQVGVRKCPTSTARCQMTKKKQDWSSNLSVILSIFRRVCVSSRLDSSFSSTRCHRHLRNLIYSPRRHVHYSAEDTLSVRTTTGGERQGASIVTRPDTCTQKADHSRGNRPICSRIARIQQKLQRLRKAVQPVGAALTMSTNQESRDCCVQTRNSHFHAFTNVGREE